MSLNGAFEEPSRGQLIMKNEKPQPSGIFTQNFYNIFWIGLILTIGGTFSVVNSFDFHGLFSFSCRMTKLAQDALGPFGVDFVFWTSSLLDFILFPIYVIRAGYSLYKRRKMEEASHVAGILLTFYFDSLLKEVYCEPRPFFVCTSLSVKSCLTDLGMPSGHLFFGTVLYLHVAAYWIKPKIASKIWRWFLYFCCVICLLYVMMGRVILAEHTISQCVMGLFYGIFYFNFAQISYTFFGFKSNWLLSFALFLLANFLIVFWAFWVEFSDDIPDDWQNQIDFVCETKTSESQKPTFQMEDMINGASGNFVLGFFYITKSSYWVQGAKAFQGKTFKETLYGSIMLVLMMVGWAGVLLVFLLVDFPWIWLKYAGVMVAYYMSGSTTGVLLLRLKNYWKQKEKNFQVRLLTL